MKKILLTLLLLSSAAHANDVPFNSDTFQIGNNFKKWEEVKSDMSISGDIASDIISVASNKTTLEKLHYVNNAVNHYVKYVTDYDNVGTVEDWALPQSTLDNRRGDCEDYSILKMALLKKVGIPASDMKIVAVIYDKNKQMHAVLSVKVDDNFYILDNNVTNARLDTTINGYSPLFAIGYSTGMIVYGKKK